MDMGGGALLHPPDSLRGHERRDHGREQREHERDDHDDDLGPETSVDDGELQRQQLADLDPAAEPRQEAPTPPAASLLPGQSEPDNVADSGEDSEDEWNYYKVEPTEKAVDVELLVQTKQQVCPEATQLSPQTSEDLDMESRLNPDAAEFVPSPTHSKPSFEDTIISQSPAGKILPLDDVEVPSLAEFQKEISQRPGEVSTDDVLSGSGFLSPVRQDLHNGSVITDDDDLIKKKGAVIEHKLTEQNLSTFSSNNPFEVSEVSSTKAEYGDESTVSCVTSSDLTQKNSGTNTSNLDSSIIDSDFISETSVKHSQDFFGFEASSEFSEFKKGLDSALLPSFSPGKETGPISFKLQKEIAPSMEECPERVKLTDDLINPFSHEQPIAEMPTEENEPPEYDKNDVLDDSFENSPNFTLDAYELNSPLNPCAPSFDYQRLDDDTSIGKPLVSQENDTKPAKQSSSPTPPILECDVSSIQAISLEPQTHPSESAEVLLTVETKNVLRSSGLGEMCDTNIEPTELIGELKDVELLEDSCSKNSNFVAAIKCSDSISAEVSEKLQEQTEVVENFDKSAELADIEKVSGHLIKIPFTELTELGEAQTSSELAEGGRKQLREVEEEFHKATTELLDDLHKPPMELDNLLHASTESLENLQKTPESLNDLHKAPMELLDDLHNVPTALAEFHKIPAGQGEEVHNVPNDMLEELDKASFDLTEELHKDSTELLEELNKSAINLLGDQKMSGDLMEAVYQATQSADLTEMKKAAAVLTEIESSSSSLPNLICNDNMDLVADPNTVDLSAIVAVSPVPHEVPTEHAAVPKESAEKFGAMQGAEHVPSMMEVSDNIAPWPNTFDVPESLRVCVYPLPVKQKDVVSDVELISPSSLAKNEHIFPVEKEHMESVGFVTELKPETLSGEQRDMVETMLNKESSEIKLGDLQDLRDVTESETIAITENIQNELNYSSTVGETEKIVEKKDLPALENTTEKSQVNYFEIDSDDIALKSNVDNFSEVPVTESVTRKAEPCSDAQKARDTEGQLDIQTLPPKPASQSDLSVGDVSDVTAAATSLSPVSAAAALSVVGAAATTIIAAKEPGSKKQVTVTTKEVKKTPIAKETEKGKTVTKPAVKPSPGTARPTAKTSPTSPTKPSVPSAPRTSTPKRTPALPSSTVASKTIAKVQTTTSAKPLSKPPTNSMTKTNSLTSQKPANMSTGKVSPASPAPKPGVKVTSSVTAKPSPTMRATSAPKPRVSGTTSTTSVKTTLTNGEMKVAEGKKTVKSTTRTISRSQTAPPRTAATVKTGATATAVAGSLPKTGVQARTALSSRTNITNGIAAKPRVPLSTAPTRPTASQIAADKQHKETANKHISARRIGTIPSKTAPAKTGLKKATPPSAKGGKTLPPANGGSPLISTGAGDGKKTDPLL